MFRGIEKPTLFLYPIDESGEAVGDDFPIVGGFFNRAIKAVGGIAALGATIAPIRCHLGDIPANQTKKRDWLTAIVLVQHEKEACECCS